MHDMRCFGTGRRVTALLREAWSDRCCRSHKQPPVLYYGFGRCCSKLSVTRRVARILKRHSSPTPHMPTTLSRSVSQSNAFSLCIKRPFLGLVASSRHVHYTTTVPATATILSSCTFGSQVRSPPESSDNSCREHALM